MEHRAVKIAIATVALMAVPVLGACSNDSADNAGHGSTTSTASTPVTPPVSVTRSAEPTAGDLTTLTPKVAWRDALATAKKEAGGQPTSIRLSHDNRLVYEIELVSGTRETSIDIDATSGTVFDRDVDDDGDMSEVIDLTGVIEPGRAMAVAVKASPGRVVEWTIERDHGRLVYDVEVRKAGDSSDVIIDAKTAEVVEVDD